MERLNLRQLEIFFRRRGRRQLHRRRGKLYLAQSTVSDNVRALEELLHLKLFHRESKRRLTLTLEGNASTATRRTSSADAALCCSTSRSTARSS